MNDRYDETVCCKCRSGYVRSSGSTMTLNSASHAGYDCLPESLVRVNAPA
jgi:hypothetical protein